MGKLKFGVSSIILGKEQKTENLKYDSVEWGEATTIRDFFRAGGNPSPVTPTRCKVSVQEEGVSQFLAVACKLLIRVLGVDSKNSKSNLRSRLMDLSSLTPDKQVKLQYWLDVIRQCRASGLTNQIWCEQHDISLKSYYYWLSKIRKLALEELPRKKNGIHMCTDQQSTALTESPAEFAELSLPDRNISRSTPAAILHIGSITVELYEGTSAQMLENILKAVQSC